MSEADERWQRVKDSVNEAGRIVNERIENDRRRDEDERLREAQQQDDWLMACVAVL